MTKRTPSSPTYLPAVRRMKDCTLAPCGFGCAGASIFDRLKSIDAAIEMLCQERKTLIAQLETFIRGDGEE